MHGIDVAVVLNGLAISMLLFLMAAGLSLIFGFLNVLNFAHGGFYLLGAYVGLSTMIRVNFWVALLAAAVFGLVVGWLLERVILARFYDRRHIDQAIVTVGVGYVIADLTQTIWGSDVHSPSPPNILAGTVDIAGRPFPVYRLFVLAVGLLIALALWLGIEHTRIGAIVRAGVADKEMVSGLGIPVHRVYTLLVALGVALAAIGGVLGSPILGVHLGMDSDIFVQTLVVIVIGGLGSLKGAFVGSILVGMTQVVGTTLIPSFAMAFSYSLMALVLLIRPQGLMARST